MPRIFVKSVERFFERILFSILELSNVWSYSMHFLPFEHLNDWAIMVKYFIDLQNA